MFDFQHVPEIRTERLLLNAVKASDDNALYDIFSDPEVTRYNDVQTFSDRRESRIFRGFIQDRFNERVGIRWAIRLADAPGKLIGLAGYNTWTRHNRCAEIGYDLLRFYWNRGFMTEALRGVIAFGFREMALNRVEALVTDTNAASCRVLEKLDFTAEGLLRQRGCWKGRYHDLWLFALLRADVAQKGLTWAGLSSTH